MPSLLQRACLELGVDVPVMRCDAGQNGTLTLYLYGGRVVTWKPEEVAEDETGIPFPDDLTAISGIGDATATLLREAGFHTFEDLINADDVSVLDVVGPAVLRRIRKYLKEHCL